MRTALLIISSLIALYLPGIASAMSGYNDCDFSDLHRFATPGLTFTTGRISKTVSFKPAALFEAAGPCVGLEPALCGGPPANTVDRGQSVIIAFERDAVACVIFQTNDSFSSGWVDKARISIKKAKPLSSLAWQGVWHADQGQTKANLTVMSVADFSGRYQAQQAHPDPESVYALLTYDPLKRSGLSAQSLGLTGYSAYSFATIGGTDTHLGMFTATTAYNGPVLLYDEAAEDGHPPRETDCLVAMLNFGDSLAVTDQGRCGGESVRFNGTFKRAKTQLR
ncbi:MAG: hypothetical protein QM647_10275 [Asticcacaulis sp.]|uniref:hypothetical protein n=1 Tax=Asticcacaulis sp. TaxID=1872648 RepID=UPI0039E597D4